MILNAIHCSDISGLFPPLVLNIVGKIVGIEDELRRPERSA